MGEVIEGQFGPADQPPPGAGAALPEPDGPTQARATLARTWEAIRAALQRLTGVSRIEEIPHARVEVLLQQYNALHAKQEELAGRLAEAEDPTLLMALERELHSFDTDAQTFVEAVNEAIPAGALVSGSNATILNRISTANPWIIGGALVGVAVLISAVVWMAVGKKSSALPARGSGTSGLGEIPRRRRARPRRRGPAKKRKPTRRRGSTRRRSATKRLPRSAPDVDVDVDVDVEDDE